MKNNFLLFHLQGCTQVFLFKVLFPRMKHLHTYSPPGFVRLHILSRLQRALLNISCCDFIFGDGLRMKKLSRRGISIYMIMKIGEHVKYHKQNLTIKIFLDCMVDIYLGIFLFLLRNTSIYCYIFLR